MTRQRSWHSTNIDAQTPSPSTDQDRAKRGALDHDARRSVFLDQGDSRGGGGSRRGGDASEGVARGGRISDNDAIKGSLPPLSPRSSREHVEGEHRARRHDRNRNENSPGSDRPVYSEASGSALGGAGGRREGEPERKSHSPRISGADRAGDGGGAGTVSLLSSSGLEGEGGGQQSSRPSSASRPASPQRSRSSATGSSDAAGGRGGGEWGSWDQGKERDDHDRDGRHSREVYTRLPSPRGCLPREGDKNEEGWGRSDKEKPLSLSMSSRAAGGNGEDLGGRRGGGRGRGEQGSGVVSFFQSRLETTGGPTRDVS